MTDFTALQTAMPARVSLVNGVYLLEAQFIIQHVATGASFIVELSQKLGNAVEFPRGIPEGVYLVQRAQPSNVANAQTLR